MPKPLPKELTSYDLLKAVAVIIMVMDHIGYYFFPDNLWWRAIGRIGFPVWFFLIGHASGRAIPPKLWGGALILMGTYLAAGSHIFPLNALVTIILLRLMIDRVMKVALHGKGHLIVLSALLFLLIIPTNYAVEYGTQALILAMAGYLVRHRQALRLSDEFVRNFIFFSLFSFVITQFFIFAFTVPHFYLMSAGTALICLWLYHFKAAQYGALSEKLPPALTGLIQIMGRRTLEIYVAHIMLFQAIALLQGQERFGWFDVKLIPQF